MSARQRLWESFKEKLLFVGIALIITVGFPILVGFAGRELSSVPGLVKLDQIGYYVLRASPVVLLLLAFFNFLSIRRRQKQINQKISEGITYLMLPRADAPPVRGAEVTLWHRIALALPYYNHISFEITGGENGLSYSLRTTDENTAREILSKVMAEWPGTQMRKGGGDPLSVATEAYAVEIKPLKKDQPIVASTNSPMAALLAEIAVLPKGVQAGMQIMVREDPFTQISHSRKADQKTRKRPTSDMPLISSGEETSKYPYKPSAEESRQVQRLDQRAQEAFLEARIIIWAAAEDSKTARKTAERLAKAVSAQYHPSNKLIKGGAKKKNLMLREHPTFAGRPWIASELGTIAHLVGSDAQPPQLQKAPAQPLPAMPDCRIDDSLNFPAYLNGSEPGLMIDKDEEELPMLTLDEEELPMLTLDDENIPTIEFENV